MENRIVCNCCGREIKNGAEQVLEDYLHIKKEWGYFSAKDGACQEFRVCEDCYDKWLASFRVPVTTTEVTELM